MTARAFDGAVEDLDEAPVRAPWETTLGRRIYGVPLTSRSDWYALHVAQPCPACGRVVAVPLVGGVYCRCTAPLRVGLRARDAAPLIPLAPPRSA